jgi:hypothetical protein
MEKIGLDGFLNEAQLQKLVEELQLSYNTLQNSFTWLGD